MDRYYEIAGVRYCVSGNPEAMCWDDGVLAAYITEKNISDRKLIITITNELSAPYGKLIFKDAHKHIYLSDDGTYIRYEGIASDDLNSAYMRIKRKGNVSEVQAKPLSVGDKSVLMAMELEHSVVEKDGVIIHASCIRVQDKAILFTAPSGTGKSTQAELWCKYRGAELINGDRCVLRRIDGKFYISGVPYCGSSGVSKNVTLPLEAVVYLTQAPFTTVSKLKGIESFRCLWEGCCLNTWNTSDVDKCLRLITDLSEEALVLKLDCTPDITAVEKLEVALRS